MKKIIASLAILTLIGCKKENKSNTNVELTTTQTEAPAVQLKEMNADQISALLQKKDNDTIYVTNFFATWCGPCMHEIPYFKEKMEEMKNEKVKFSFISLDDPNSWNTAVNAFAKESGLAKNIILFNHSTMKNDFFSKNFQQWDGGAIPFTLITKGDKRDEHIGMMSKEDLTAKINSFK